MKTTPLNVFLSSHWGLDESDKYCITKPMIKHPYQILESFLSIPAKDTDYTVVAST
jgi:hypothetical protein